MSLSTHNLEWWCMLIRENLSSSSLSLFTLIGSASSAAAEAAEAYVASPPSLFDAIPMVVMRGTLGAAVDGRAAVEEAAEDAAEERCAAGASMIGRAAEMA
jgi:hypothetical protein